MRPLWIVEGESGRRRALIHRLEEAGLAEHHLAILHAVPQVARRNRQGESFPASSSAPTSSSTPTSVSTPSSSSAPASAPLSVDADELTDRIIEVVRGHAADAIVIECDTAAEAKAVERCTDDLRARRIVALQSVVLAAAPDSGHTRRQVAGESAGIANSDFVWIGGARSAMCSGATHGTAHGGTARSNKTAHEPASPPSRPPLDETARWYRRVNPDVQVFDDATFPRLVRAMRPPSHVWRWAVPAAALAVAYVLFADDLARGGLPIARFNAIFVGVFLQAVPFLAVGVLISAVVDLYVTSDWIGRHLPRNPVLAQLVALLLGFCLPVCDCSAIPIFHSLVRKRVPLPVALTFMLASPSINPIVIFSTWYAFNGNWRIVAVRCGLGALCALLVGASMAVRAPEFARVLRHVGATDDASPMQHHHGDAARNDAAQGAATGTPRANPAATFVTRVAAVLRQARYEFFDVGRYLVFGILISDVLQIALPAWHGSLGGWPTPLALLAMMALAFLLSLCSSADAVVARSMLTVAPLGPMLGFLVFGPMMDVKNVMMLAAGFRKGFVMRLAATCAVVCFAVVAVFLLVFGKGVLGV